MFENCLKVWLNSQTVEYLYDYPLNDHFKKPITAVLLSVTNPVSIIGMTEFQLCQFRPFQQNWNSVVPVREKVQFQNWKRKI